jgi:hypothetical protein
VKLNKWVVPANGIMLMPMSEEAAVGLMSVPPATGAPELSTFHIPTTREAIPVAPPTPTFTSTANCQLPAGNAMPPAPSTIQPLHVAGIVGAGVTAVGNRPEASTPGEKGK